MLGDGGLGKFDDLYQFTNGLPALQQRLHNTVSRRAADPFSEFSYFITKLIHIKILAYAYILRKTSRGIAASATFQDSLLAASHFLDYQAIFAILSFYMAEETVAQAGQVPAYQTEASREMIDAGVFYGRKKSKTNLKMRQFVVSNRGGIEVINLEKTEEALALAVAFVTEKVRNGGTLLLIATEPAAESGILAMAKKFAIPYVTHRWIGGTLTNFRIIAGRVEHLKKIRSELASGALDKYTKKERVEIDREIHRLEELMGGLEAMPREPDLIVMIDPNLHITAVREARIKKIPIIALGNLDADPDTIDYLVPGNDKAKTSIEWFLGKIEKAIEDGVKMKAVAAAVKAAETPAAPTGPAAPAAPAAN